MEGDFSGVKRSMHRKIKEAKAKGTNKIEISVDYLMNVSKTYDELLDKYRWSKNPKIGKWIERSETLDGSSRKEASSDL